jgi:hypothetical protein
MKFMKKKNILSIFFKMIIPIIMIISILMIYYRTKLPYENGRYFDSNTGIVYQEQSLLFYRIIALICGIIIGIYFLYKIKNK